ncbi:MAG: FMN reductase (NADPH) [Streblomastix strix]|uniref:FMN reductase (NADPH) n=1 Tax=Streblomastix strix TaxID=222440 RepID=A0A5J4VVK1_9EUKA|nr:MAG: FMN reductase (NADPH) [Streblomastix strix]
MSGKSFIDVLAQRRSIRSYTKDPIDREQLQRILSAVIANVPTAGNLQAYRIVVVTDPRVKHALQKAAHNQDQVGEAAADLVFLADETKEAKYGRRGRELYSVQDATNACMIASLAAAEQGLGTCWVGAFDEAKVSEVINAKDGLRPVAILTLGHPAERGKSHKRQTVDEIVSFETL